MGKGAWGRERGNGTMGTVIQMIYFSHWNESVGMASDYLFRSSVEQFFSENSFQICFLLYD